MTAAFDVHEMDELKAVIEYTASLVDDMDAQQAIQVRQRLTAMIELARDTIALCDARAIHLLDGQPLKIGDVVWMETQTGKWRPDQRRIRNLVESAAQVDDDEQPLPVRDAVRKCAQLFTDLYVSPSTAPKIGGLRRLGVSDTKDVCEWENGDRKLEAIDTRKGDR